MKKEKLTRETVLLVRGQEQPKFVARGTAACSRIKSANATSLAKLFCLQPSSSTASAILRVSVIYDDILLHDALFKENLSTLSDQLSWI